MIKYNNDKSYQNFKEKIYELAKEKEEVYKQNEKVINKVLTQYLDEVKK